ncbi:MAG: DUF4364 family protein [Nitrososphaerales archaeon]
MEIHMDIIMALTEEPKHPTKLMDTTNLTWTKFQQCLKELMKNGYVQEVEGLSRKRYAITQKGRDTLDKYRRFVKDMIPLSSITEYPYFGKYSQDQSLGL